MGHVNVMNGGDGEWVGSDVTVNLLLLASRVNVT
jgi:hypothetical protein